MEKDRRVNDRQQLPTTGIYHGGEQINVINVHVTENMDTSIRNGYVL